MVGRFRPPHLGAVKMLEILCKYSREVVIGIGSANKYDVRNPFTAAETKEMLDYVLGPQFTNYRVVLIDDYGHCAGGEDGHLWREAVKETMGELDYFISGNPYVQSLLKDYYEIVNSLDVVREFYVPIVTKGSAVRSSIAKGGWDWQSSVPPAVSEYITSRGLDKRLQRDFPELKKLEDVWRSEGFSEEQAYTTMFHAEM
ncbi:hypothetical protein GOV10_05395 [Candidatus Woesearchaeota archaeon]|nr:hypothetical protein [Candidatus Woesearchaeota archaeon]